MLENLGVVNLWTYALGALVLVLMPGPNSLFVLKTSVQGGTARAMKAACAVFLGDAILIACAFLGIASILQAHPALFTTVRFAGAVYLAWLGLGALARTLPRRGRAPQKGSATASEGQPPFRTALLLSVTNPKAILFYVSFFVQFIDPAYPRPWVPYLVLASILEAFSVLYMSSLAFAGSRISRMVAGRPGLGRLGSALEGSLFLGFAGKIASL